LGFEGLVLSGKDNQTLAEVYKITKGKTVFNSIGKLPIIASGGVASGADVINKVKHGASAVQLFEVFLN